jgi:hypothetical protein
LVAPLVLAGFGIGLALPALAGELLRERTPTDAGRLLALRHAAIALTLLALAPLIATQLESATHRARLQAVAALLDSPLSPTEKLALAPSFARSLNNDDPRRALAHVVAARRDRVGSSDQASLTRLQAQGNAIIVEVAADSLRDAFLIAGAFGLLAAMIIRPPPRLPATAILAGASLVVPVGYAVAKSALPTSMPPVRSACHEGGSRGRRDPRPASRRRARRSRPAGMQSGRPPRAARAPNTARWIASRQPRSQAWCAKSSAWGRLRTHGVALLDRGFGSGRGLTGGSRHG